MTVAAIDWTTVGAIAGPVLALISLAWQATERRRRPLLEQKILWQWQHDNAGWRDALIVAAYARIVNPRPSALIVRRVEIQAAERVRFRPWRREVLASGDRMIQVPGTGEENAAIDYYPYVEPRTLRTVVRLKGFPRSLRGPWLEDYAADEIAEVNEEKRARGR